MVGLLPAWIFLCAICGTIVGIWCGNIKQGILWATIVGWTPVGLLYAVAIWHKLNVGDLPGCCCGCKKNRCLEYMRTDAGPPVQDEFECRSCGRRYRSREKMFYEIDADGNETPYAKQCGLLPWKYFDDETYV
ncbi:hypothetical protein Enr10x_09820 [Gimesia panareensis]|uniref:Uncharacterized protein n=1 Tax=Gimesia panareensis TaxID=2527978 RepID=A0A517Q239_9PLAN|nr:hypothetical protein Enr10x_09820 [Gimesia panareensis]QDU48630.1 hypothetical protein Pan110_09450 [Gimesia panareensis]